MLSYVHLDWATRPPIVAVQSNTSSDGGQHITDATGVISSHWFSRPSLMMPDETGDFEEPLRATRIGTRTLKVKSITRRRLNVIDDEF